MEAAGISCGGPEVKLRLKDDLSGQLKHPRAAEFTGNLLNIDDRPGVAGGADSGARQGCRVKSWIAATVREVWVGRTGMVEHVSRLCAELESRSLPYLEILEDGEV